MTRVGKTLTIVAAMMGMLLAVTAGCGGRREQSETPLGNGGTVAEKETVVKVEDLPVIQGADLVKDKPPGEFIKRLVEAAAPGAPRGERRGMCGWVITKICLSSPRSTSGPKTGPEGCGKERR